MSNNWNHGNAAKISNQYHSQSQDLAGDKSLVQVMAWCRQVTAMTGTKVGPVLCLQMTSGGNNKLMVISSYIYAITIDQWKIKSRQNYPLCCNSNYDGSRHCSLLNTNKPAPVIRWRTLRAFWYKQIITVFNFRSIISDVLQENAMIDVPRSSCPHGIRIWLSLCLDMMTSSNGNILRVTGH